MEQLRSREGGQGTTLSWARATTADGAVQSCVSTLHASCLDSGIAVPQEANHLLHLVSGHDDRASESLKPRLCERQTSEAACKVLLACDRG